MKRGETIAEIDARPGDALALALRVGCPVFVRPDVLDAAAIAVPESRRHREWHGTGAAMIVDEMKAIMGRHSAGSGDQDQTIEERERETRGALVEQLFGDG